MASILDSINGVFNNDMIRKASTAFGESESGVARAVSGGIPSLLLGMMYTGQEDGGVNLLNLSKQSASSGILDNAGSLFGGPNSSELLKKGGNLLSGVLGGSKSVGLTSLISSYGGVKASSSHSILSAIAPIALAFLGRHAISNNLSAAGLLNWLTGQRSEITSTMRAGLSVSDLFDDSARRVAEHTRSARPATYAAAATGKSNKMLWLLLGLVALGVIIYLAKGCNKKEETTTTETTTVSTPPVAETVAPTPAKPMRESMKVKLADGTEIDAYKGGIEDMLVNFLNDPNAKPSKDTWFDFDNLTFESGSARITKESQVQVNNIAAILKAYPKVKIKIGGYTDVIGDAAANKKLSQERADATVAGVKAAGANAAQLVGAEGYGSQFAKAAADAPDSEKEKDRRISVNVKEK